MKDSILPIGQQWKARLAVLLAGVSKELVVSSPFISSEGAKFVSSKLTNLGQRKPRARIVTDLSPSSVAQGVIDPFAILQLADSFCEFEVRHLARLHAKVYIADISRAIITSGNLTSGGLYRNYEYGVEISDRKGVASIRSDILDYAALGAQFDVSGLRAYAECALEVRREYGKAQASIARNAMRRLENAIRGIGDELVRAQLAGGPVHAVFSRTILFLLQKNRSLKTVVLNRLIQGIHPELCDDSIDRVIDGENYGKKWKHQIRTAQQNLKRKGLIELRNGEWSLIESGGIE